MTEQETLSWCSCYRIRFQFYLWFEMEVEVNIAVADEATYIKISAIFLFFPSLHERALWPVSLICIWIPSACPLFWPIRHFGSEMSVLWTNKAVPPARRYTLYSRRWCPRSVSLCWKAEVKTWPKHWGLNPFFRLEHSRQNEMTTEIRSGERFPSYWWQ